MNKPAGMDMTTETPPPEDRKTILLRAAYELLKKAERSYYVLNAMEITIHYDDADCDGYCLMEDIEAELERGDK